MSSPELQLGFVYDPKIRFFPDRASCQLTSPPRSNGAFCEIRGDNFHTVVRYFINNMFAAESATFLRENQTNEVAVFCTLIFWN